MARLLKILKISLLLIALIIGAIFYFVPERKLKKISKQSTKQIAIEMDVNPTLAKFLVHTKLGRKIAYLTIKKELTIDLEETK